MDVPGFAVVTGAASGIGRARANAFANEGAAGVALLDVNEEALAVVKAEIEASQPRIDSVIQKAAHDFERIDYVVNAAGIAMKHEGGAAFAKTPDWHRIMSVNLTGTFFVLRAAAQIMLKQEPILSSINGRPLQRGSIINFGSIQAVVGIPLSTAYTASKHAILGLTKTASEDYAKDGLRINAICPGYTETLLKMKSPAIYQAMMERITTMVPMMRVGKAQEIADGVLYLAGGRSSFVTGTSLFVDGGYTQR